MLRYANQTNINDKEHKDQILHYQKALFTINMYLRNINDAIKEGDGLRLLTTYKFAMLYFKATNHHKYALTILRLLCTVKYSPAKAFSPIWNRFIGKTVE